MTFRKLLLAAACVATMEMPVAAYADPAAADDYVANIRQQVVFVDVASQLASERSTSGKLKSFARSEASEQHRAADDLRLWETGRAISSFGPSMVTATNNIETVTDQPDTIMTGRSAAVDAAPVTEWSRPEPGVAMVSPGMVVVPQLQTLDGDAFDQLYKKTIAISLKELAGFYEAYSLTGKDMTLRAMAQRELPLVKQRLTELEAL